MSVINLPEFFYKAILLLIELGVILGSLGVVLFTNIVYSAFLLGWVLICISFLYILLNADFVAAVQILIYVGTINVLIVFAVMLINKSQYFSFLKYWTVGDGTALALCITLFLSIIAAILNTPWSKISLIVLSNKIVEEEPLTNNVQRIGFHLLTDSTLPFELLSIILLIALVGAITMARREETVEAEESEALKTKDDFPF